MDLKDLIIPYSNYKGNWDAFIERLYATFEQDFIRSMPRFKCDDVDFYDKRKIETNKEECFWHLTSRDYPIRVNGIIRKERKPDIIRAERIAWIKEIIENNNDSSVEMWRNLDFPKGARYHLWYRKEFLVVLEDIKFGYYHLITSFYTKTKNEIEKYNLEIGKWGLTKKDAASATSQSSML